jgi:hypothetical protein
MTPKNVKGIEKLVKEIFSYLGAWQIKNMAGVIYSLTQVSSPLVSNIARAFPHTNH